MDHSLYLLRSIPLVIFLVLLYGVFAVAEYSLIRSQPAKLKSADFKNTRGVESALWLIGRLHVSLSATQLATTLSTILLAVVGVSFFQLSLMRVLGNWSSFEPHSVYLFSLVVAVAIVSIIHLLTKVVAKSLAIHDPERALCFLAPLLWMFATVCRPLLSLVNTSANIFLKPFSAVVPQVLKQLPYAEELSQLESQSGEEGFVDKQEAEMIRGVIGFSQTIAREVMVPRTDLVTIKLDSSLEEALAVIIDSGFSRFPVVGRAVDDVKGILLVRDLFLLMAKKGSEASSGFSVEKLMRKAFFVPDTKPIDDLLSEFKRRKQHMAIVLDEHGGVDGLVTLEDLVEEIVGDIFDESDDQENWVQIQENGEILVDGGVLVADLNQQLELKIPEGNYDTIAGFIFTALGRMPKTGDEIIIRSDGFEALSSTSASGHSSDSPASSKSQLKVVDENSAELNHELLVIVEKIDNHRIESALFEHLAIIRKHLRNPEFLRHEVSTFAVTSTNRHQCGTWLLRERREKGEIRPPACADNADAQFA